MAGALEKLERFEEAVSSYTAGRCRLTLSSSS